MKYIYLWIGLTLSIVISIFTFATYMDKQRAIITRNSVDFVKYISGAEASETLLKSPARSLVLLSDSKSYDKSLSILSSGKINNNIRKYLLSFAILYKIYECPDSLEEIQYISGSNRDDIYSHHAKLRSINSVKKLAKILSVIYCAREGVSNTGIGNVIYKISDPRLRIILRVLLSS